LADGSVTTPKIADANVTPAKLTQSDYANVYKIKVDTATYAINAAAAVNATTATYVLGSGVADGRVTTPKIADANVTPANLRSLIMQMYIKLSRYGNICDKCSSGSKCYDGDLCFGIRIG
jgi:hypothetical protein